jgi:hypothetical protein
MGHSGHCDVTPSQVTDPRVPGQLRSTELQLVLLALLLHVMVVVPQSTVAVHRAFPSIRGRLAASVGADMAREARNA